MRPGKAGPERPGESGLGWAGLGWGRGVALPALLSQAGLLAGRLGCTNVLRPWPPAVWGVLSHTHLYIHVLLFTGQ